MTPLITLGIDPGSTHTGYALLAASPTGETLVASGTWRRPSREACLVRHEANCQALAALMADYRPALVAYEEFTYRGGAKRVDPGQTQWIDRLIGVILMCTAWPWHPAVVGLDAREWGHALTGSRQHDKAAVAWAVNCRLGTTFAGDARDNHQSDACGLALVAVDRARFAQRCGQAAEGNMPDSERKRYAPE